MKYLSKLTDIGKSKDFREIQINTTYFKIPKWDPCKTCGKWGMILSGLPNVLRVQIPLTSDEFEAIAMKPFFIAGSFETKCINGFSHIVTGENPKRRWIISLKPNYAESEYVDFKGSMEQALVRFIPILMKSEERSLTLKV